MKRVKIDKLGRIVLPISYRKALNITTETELIIDCGKNVLTVTPSVILCRICEKNLVSDKEIPICDECTVKIINQKNKSQDVT